MPDDRFDPLAWLRGVYCADCTLDTQESAVTTALIKHADSTGRARPGIGTLAAETRASRRKVILSLDELVHRGLLLRERQKRGAGYGANHYRLPSAPDKAALSAPRVGTAGSASRALVHPVHDAPSSAPHAPPSAPHALPVVHPMHMGSASHAPELLRGLPIGTTQGTMGAKTTTPKRPPKKRSKKGSQKARGRSPTKGSPKRETELPSDWTPGAAHIAYAAKHGLHVELEADAFRGNAEKKAATAVSWDGAFRTWLANQAKWNRERSGVRSTGTRSVQNDGGFSVAEKMKNQGAIDAAE